MPDAQNSNGFECRREPIESDKPGLAARNDQLPQTVFGKAPYQRVSAQDLERLLDASHLGRSKLRIVFGIKGEDAFEIFQRARRERYFRQAFGLGRRARLPSARAVM